MKLSQAPRNSFFQGWRDNPLIVISPVIETTGQETEKFLAKDFLQAMIDGDGANVPVFLGTTGDELLFQALRKFFQIFIN